MKSVVYFICATKTDRVKIGFTGNLKRRLSEIRKGCPDGAEVLRTIDGGRDVEAWLHTRFRDNHLSLEWFRFDPEMLTIEPPSDWRRPRSRTRRGGDANGPFAVAMTRWITAAFRHHMRDANRSRDDAVALVASSLGLTTRRIITFLTQEGVRVWEEEYQRTMSWYRGFTDLELARLEREAAELRRDQIEIDHYYAEREDTQRIVEQNAALQAEINRMKLQIQERLASMALVAASGALQAETGNSAEEVTR